MTRKSGSDGAPDGRKDEQPFHPPTHDQPLQRSLDLALESEWEDDDEPPFIYGDIAEDAEADDPAPLVVVNVPGLTIAEWEYETETLADRHPKYPDDDEVVIVVPLEALEHHMPGWDERPSAIPIEDLLDAEIPFAPFPGTRLVRVRDSHLRE